MNLSEVEQSLRSLSKDGFAEEKGGKWTVDLTKMGVDKLLGSGRISTPITIRVAEASKGAEEKLKKAGGALLKE
jgi:large subunit ribosomal protein L15